MDMRDQFAGGVLIRRPPSPHLLKNKKTLENKIEKFQNMELMGGVGLEVTARRW